MQMPVITHWHGYYEQLFGRQPIVLSHNLHESILFSRATLAELIDRYPEDLYTLMRVGPSHDERVWVEGKLGGTTGFQAIEEIEAGNLWLNLRHTHSVDRRYQELLDGIYREFGDLMPKTMGATFKRICGILISSPGAVVPYHFDTSGQNLWQIHGTKRIWLYPPAEPFLMPDQLERSTLYHDETSIEYAPWFDDYAHPFYLRPGCMVHWPLNAPHRITNGPTLSVSFTTEFYTDAIQRHTRATAGNGLLREMGLGLTTQTRGLSYAMRAGVFAAAKLSGLIDRRRKHQIAFRLAEKKSA